MSYEAGVLSGFSLITIHKRLLNVNEIIVVIHLKAIGIKV